jgi:prepilin-type N-terminal cleavage/methylation domain-containing protein
MSWPMPQDRRAMPRPTACTRPAAGFSLIEILIVVTLIAIIAGIAVVNLLSGRLNANERAVISTLRTVCSAEMQFKTMNLVDADGNSASEYGTLGEMSGAVMLRGTGVTLNPNLLSLHLGNVDADGHVGKHGYLFALFLPDAAGNGLPETPANQALIDPRNSASFWTCVAWPATHGQTGWHTFFVNQRGDILMSTDADYSGKTRVPAPNCALVGVTGNNIAAQQTAVSGPGVDGRNWVPVN